MWVDATQTPATIWLAGQLDSWTAGNLIPIVRDLLAEGIRDFELRTDALNVADSTGTATLDEFRELVLRHGGRLTWGGSTMNAGPQGNGDSGVPDQVDPGCGIRNGLPRRRSVPRQQRDQPVSW
jgi:hypothetical protein